MGCSNCANSNGKPAGCRSNGYCASNGCEKLEVFDWLADVAPPSGVPIYDRVFIEKRTPYLSTDKAFVIQKEFNKAITHIERNANTKILFTDLTFTLFKVIGK